jgi:predicted ABC-type ATPase
MIVVAGPPGSGKSSLFPVSAFGCDFFNADDEAAKRNGGSYIDISLEIRRAVNIEFERFIVRCVAERKSFALETTLRSDVTFRQAEMARAAGFRIDMRYIALRDFELHLERVAARAEAGGHSASEPTLRRIYDASIANLAQAPKFVDRLMVYDNSAAGGPLAFVAKTENGLVDFVAEQAPAWAVRALGLG